MKFFCRVYGTSRRNKNRKMSLSAVVTQVSMAGHKPTLVPLKLLSPSCCLMCCLSLALICCLSFTYYYLLQIVFLS